jgi:DNA-binding NtrC family response regulator
MARILIIDDEESLRSLLRRVLTRAGHETQEVGDGKAGLKAVGEGAFDLVITDIIMPEMEGIDFILQLHRRAPGLPIIAMSGGGRIRPEGYLKTAQLAGAKKALTKPFTIAELQSAVAECLGLPPAEGAAPVSGTPS